MSNVRLDAATNPGPHCEAKRPALLAFHRMADWPGLCVYVGIFSDGFIASGFTSALALHRVMESNLLSRPSMGVVPTGRDRRSVTEPAFAPHQKLA